MIRSILKCVNHLIELSMLRAMNRTQKIIRSNRTVQLWGHAVSSTWDTSDHNLHATIPFILNTNCITSIHYKCQTDPQQLFKCYKHITLSLGMLKLVFVFSHIKITTFYYDKQWYLMWAQVFLNVRIGVISRQLRTLV